MHPRVTTITAAVGVLGLCAIAYAWGRSHGSAPAPSEPNQAMKADPTSPPNKRVAPSPKSSASAAATPQATPPAAFRRPPPAPLHRSQTIHAAADALPDLLGQWDPGVATDLFGDIDLEPLEEKLAWMHAQVGACQGAASMGSSSASQGRFSYVCDRGVVEAGFAVSDPDEANVAKMRAGVRDIDPPESVTTAARDAAELIAQWDDQAFEDRFAQSFRDKLGANMPTFTEGLRDELGTCTVGPVDLASPNGALFVLECEHGRRTMVVSLDGQQKIRGLRVVPLRRDPAASE